MKPSVTLIWRDMQYFGNNCYTPIKRKAYKCIEAENGQKLKNIC